MLSDGDTVTVYLVTSNVHGCQNDTDKVTFITYVDPVVDFSISPFDWLPYINSKHRYYWN